MKEHIIPWAWGGISRATMRFEGKLKRNFMVPKGTARKLAKASNSAPINLIINGSEWE